MRVPPYPSNMSASDSRTKLFTSAQRVPVGHALSLGWEVISLDAVVSNVQLARTEENSLEVIESMPNTGARQLIFTRPGVVTFTLTATFRDGVKRVRQIRIRVEG